jgi:pimeloyl-ACP methyl ester carboxylesterase
MARDLAGLLDALGVNACYLAGYDLGAGTAAAFARDYPARVKRAAFLEFGLAGFGYERFMTPSPDWTLNSNWHLAIFTVPDAAVWLLTGRERELLSWFFYHFRLLGQRLCRSGPLRRLRTGDLQARSAESRRQLLRRCVAGRQRQRVTQAHALGYAGTRGRW